MENIFEGMVSEEELKDISELNQTESGAGILDKISQMICPTAACTPPCAK